MAEETQDPQEKPDDELKITKMRKSGGHAPLSIKPETLPVAKQDPTRHYWCGVTPDCPFGVITAGGFDFPAFIQKQVPRKGSSTETILGESQFAGRVHAMTDSQANRCLKGIANRIIRRNANRDMKAIKGGRKQFRPMAGDEPLARYVYMIEVDDPDNINYAYPAKNVTTLIPR